MDELLNVGLGSTKGWGWSTCFGQKGEVSPLNLDPVGPTVEGVPLFSDEKVEADLNFDPV
jgi:hypothetical protein